MFFPSRLAVEGCNGGGAPKAFAAEVVPPVVAPAFPPPLSNGVGGRVGPFRLRPASGGASGDGDGDGEGESESSSLGCGGEVDEAADRAAPPEAKRFFFAAVATDASPPCAEAVVGSKVTPFPFSMPLAGALDGRCGTVVGGGGAAEADEKEVDRCNEG